MAAAPQAQPPDELAPLKKELQGHFTDGLVTLVGLGLSAQAGLPTMPELAAFLRSQMPQRLPDPLKAPWGAIEANLIAGQDIETALKTVDFESPLLQHITQLTSQLIEERELVVVQRVLGGQQELPFSKLLPSIMFNCTRAPVITSNYDRLIELATEIAGYGVDTGFCGQDLGEFNPKLSHEALGQATLSMVSRKQLRRTYRKHVALYKPHGSLDWHEHRDKVIRCHFRIDAPRLMITPGVSKYRKGYEVPFDHHRTSANEAIDRAGRFLIVGYGFNDDQLETHLRTELKRGKPCLLLTKSLTGNSGRLVAECPSITAIVSNGPDGGTGSLVLQSGKRTEIPNKNIWDLGVFVQEILS